MAKAGGYDHLIRIGADLSGIAKDFAKEMVKMEKSAHIEVTTEYKEQKGELEKRVAYLQKVLQLSKEISAWDSGKVLNRMGKVTEALGKTNNDANIKALSKQLLMLNELGKKVNPKFNAEQFEDDIGDALDRLKSGKLGDFKPTEIDLSVIVPEASIMKAFKQVQDAVQKFNESTKLNIDVDLSQVVSVDDMLQAQKKKDEIAALKTQNKELIKQLEELKKKYQEVDRQMADSQMPIDWQAATKKELDSLKSQLADAEAEVKAYQDFLGDIGYNNDTDEAIAKQEKLKQKINELTEAVKKKDTEIDTLNKRAETLAPKSEIEKKIEEIKKLTAQIEKAEEEIDTLRTRIDTLGDSQVNNVDKATLKDVHGLLDKYDEDQKEYHFDKAAMLYGYSGLNERVIRGDKDITDDLITRFKRLNEESKNAQNLINSINRIGANTLPLRDRLKLAEEELEALKKKQLAEQEIKQDAADAEAFAMKEAQTQSKQAETVKEVVQAEKEKADAIKESTKAEKEAVATAKEKTKEEEKQATATEENTKKTKAKTKAQTAQAQQPVAPTQPVQQAPTQQPTQPPVKPITPVTATAQAGDQKGGENVPIGTPVQVPVKLTIKDQQEQIHDLEIQMAGRRVSVGAKLKIGDVDGQVKDLTTSLGDKKMPIDTNLKIDDADTKIANITGSLMDKYVDVNIRPSEQSIKNFVANLQTELNKLNTENTPVASEQTVIDQDKIQSEVKQSEENFRSLRQAVVDYIASLSELDRISEKGVIPNLNQRRVLKSDAQAAADVYKNSNFKDNEAENVLVRYVSRLKDVDKALKSLGIENEEVFEKIKNKLKSAIDVQEQYSNASTEAANKQAQLSSILKDNYLSDTNKNDINGFLKQIESNSQIKNFAKSVKDTFGIEIPTSIKQAKESVQQFDQTLDTATKNEQDDSNQVQIDVKPKVDREKFVSGVNAQLGDLNAEGSGINPVQVPIIPKEINAQDFVSDVNVKVDPVRNDANVTPVQIPVKISDEATGKENIQNIVTEEIATLQKLVDFINDTVTKAINNKSEAFQQEQKTVSSVVTNEVKQLNNLNVALTKIKNLIDGISKIAKDIRINIDSTAINTLSDALERLQSLTVPDFSNLSILNEVLKLTKGRSAKFNEYATDIESGIKKLMSAFANGNYTQQMDDFLARIQRLSDTSAQFKQMVTALNSLDNIGKVTASAAVSGFNKATSDYISAYSKNAKNGDAESAARLSQANAQLEESYRQLNDAVDKGLLSGEQVRHMYNERKKTIDELRAGTDAEKVAVEQERASNENARIAIDSYIEATEKLYKAKLDLAKNPINVDIEIEALEKDANAALSLLKELHDQKKITDEVFEGAKAKASGYETDYTDKAQKLEAQRLSKIDAALNKGTFGNTINKFSEGFRDFNALSGDVLGKVNELKDAFDVITDSAQSDAEKINAFMRFDSVKKELNKLYNDIKANNPFNELSPDKTKLNFNYYTESFKKLRDKALELRDAINMKKPKEEIDSLRLEVDGLEQLLKGLAKEDTSKLFLRNTQRMRSSFETLSNNDFAERYPEILNKARQGFQNLTQQVKNGEIDLDKYNESVGRIQETLDRTSKYMNGDSIFGQFDDSSSALNAFRQNISGLGTITQDITESLASNDGTVKKWTATYKEADGTLKQVQATYDTVTKNMSMHSTLAGKELVGFASALDMLKKKYKELSVYWTSNLLSPFRLIGYFRNAINVVQEYDDSLTEMRKVTDTSVDTLKEFQKESFNLANAVGTTGLQIQKSTADWLRLGKGFEEAKRAASETNVLMNVSEFQSIDEATKSMIAMKQAYDELDYRQIIDELNIVGNSFSISTSDLAQGLQNAAAALKTQGNSIEESIALITAGNSIIQDVQKVAAGVRTISLRIASSEISKKQLEELGEDVSDYIVQTRAKLQETIKSLTKTESNKEGVNIIDPNGSLKSTYQILKEISGVYQEIQKEDKQFGTNRASAIVEYLAGVFTRFCRNAKDFLCIMHYESGHI